MIVTNKSNFHESKTNTKPNKMSHLLHIEVSPMGANSYSRKVGAAYVESFAKTHSIPVLTRDLSKERVPHLDAEAISASYVPADQRPESMQAKHQYRLKLIEELKSAKAVVITTPMWNWGVPSVLKAYIDQIILMGELDHLTAKHLEGKSVTIVIASGAGYGPGSWHPEWDYETGYLNHIFTLLGSKDVKIIRTEYTVAGVVPGMEKFIETKEKMLQESIAEAQKRAVAV